jgi:uncharacterized protein
VDIQTIKILIVGSIESEKRTFIKAFAEIDIISVDHPRPRPPESNHTIEFGRITLDESSFLYLFGYDLFLFSRFSGREDFLDSLKDIEGFCVLIDSTSPQSLYEGQAILKYTTLLDVVPHIIVANKQDRDDAMTVGQIRREMQLPDDTIILPCVATERASVAHVLNTLLAMIRPDLTERVT